MPTGKQLVFNDLERVVHTDHQRSATFARYEAAEAMRFLADAYTDEEDQLGAGYVLPSAVGTPLRAEILNGLMVRPQLGTFDLLVDEGALFALTADAVSEESPYKFVRDPGVTALATLTLAANGAGTTRVDVIECSVDATTLDTLELRDVFNTGTGTFTPTNVTKTRTARLTYRVRQGTAGAGYPAAAAGWVPLAVASLPAGAANNDAVTFWDVRPLVNDRARGPAQLTRRLANYDQVQMTIDDISTPGVIRAFGSVDVHQRGRRMGGVLRRGSPGTDDLWVDMLDAANQEDGFVMPADGFVYLYLCSPLRMGRWARYTDAPAARLPRAPRGLLLVSTLPPSNSGEPSNKLYLPAGYGLGTAQPVQTSEATCIAAAYSRGGTLRGGLLDGRVLWLHRASAGLNGLQLAAGAANTTNATFTLTEGTHYPANAKAIYVALRATFTIAPNALLQVQDGEIDVCYPGTATPICQVHGGRHTWINNAVGAVNVEIGTPTVRVPLVGRYPLGLSSAAKDLIWQYSIGGGIPVLVGTPVCAIYGWEL